VFRGTSVLNLDAKGRMAMPAKYREQLMASCGGRMMITVDRDRCLLLYPMPAWEEVEAQLNQLPGLDQHVRRLLRDLMGSSEELELDAQGRIWLSPALREFANLENEWRWSDWVKSLSCGTRKLGLSSGMPDSRTPPIWKN
jgi:MraZ protein